MPTYTLVITGADGHQHTTLTDFPDDATIVSDTRGVISSEHPSIAVGRGVDPEVEFLGVWDWCGGHPIWTAEE